MVHEHILECAIFEHRDGFVMLEHVPVGVCDTCGYRYYHASLLHRVEDIIAKRQPAERMALIPAAQFA